MGETREQQVRTIRLVLVGAIIALAGTGAAIVSSNGNVEGAIRNIMNRPAAARSSGNFSPAYEEYPTPPYVKR